MRFILDSNIFDKIYECREDQEFTNNIPEEFINLSIFNKKLNIIS